MTLRRFWFTIVLGPIALVVFAAGSLSLWEAWTKYRSDAERLSDTSFGEGPLRYPAWLRPYLAQLPSPAELGRNGLRFVAKPELDQLTYAAAFRDAGSTAPAKVVLLIVHERVGTAPITQRFVCMLPARSYRWLTIAIDDRTREFTGNAYHGTDGTSLGFERIRGSRLWSGGGNFIEPYRGLGEIVLTRLREACPYAPLPDVGEDWYLREATE